MSIFDMKVYGVRSEEELAALDIQKLWYETRQKIEGIDYSECMDGFQYVHTTHLASGMDVGYYAYLWYVPKTRTSPNPNYRKCDSRLANESSCSTMAQDIFLSKFADDPMNKAVWEKYRREILQYGGSHPDLLKMVEDFLGRPTNPDALVEGLARADAA